MREIVHLQAGQCGNQIGAKVCYVWYLIFYSSVKLSHAPEKKRNEDS